MNKISSFTVNHDTLKEGLYISRIDGDTVTYDLRMKIPNGGDYLENGAIHTIEHLFATYVRNSSFSDKIIYAGPMGCRTGFYFIVRDSVSHQQVLELLTETFKFVSEFQGGILGTQKSECGNYLDHDLEGAKFQSEIYYKILKTKTIKDLNY